MATGSERPKVTRHTTLWMGSNNLRLLCRNRSLDSDKRKREPAVHIDPRWLQRSQELFLDLETMCRFLGGELLHTTNGCEIRLSVWSFQFWVKWVRVQRTVYYLTKDPKFILVLVCEYILCSIIVFCRAAVSFHWLTIRCTLGQHHMFALHKQTVFLEQSWTDNRRE